MPSGVEQNDSGGSRVWESLELKINLGDYNNVVVSLGASTDVFPDETITDALNDLHATLAEALADRARTLQETHGG